MLLDPPAELAPTRHHERTFRFRQEWALDRACRPCGNIRGHRARALAAFAQSPRFKIGKSDKIILSHSGDAMTNDLNNSALSALLAPPDQNAVDENAIVSEPLSYGLMKLVLNQDRFVPISKEAFETITVARDCLMQLVVIEEKFNFVVENLNVLEKAVHEAADLNKTFPIATVEFQIAKSDINRHVANLVALGRMFIEQSLVHVDKLNKLADKVLFDLAASRARQYDARLGYRLFEELRNYMLHRGSAVHFVDFHSRKEYDANGAMSLRRDVFAYASAAQLAEDKKFKRRVSAELEAIGDRHDLVAMGRDYVAGLWDTQLEFRRALEDFVSDTEAAYVEGAYLYAEVDREDELPAVVALAGVARSEDGSIKEKTPIVLDLMAQREHYEQKNGEAARLRLDPTPET